MGSRCVVRREASAGSGADGAACSGAAILGTVEARFGAEELAEWKRQGWKNFYHYGRRREERLGYSFVEDAMQYEEEPEFPQPALILHGTHDEVVPVATSRAITWPAIRNVILKEFASGHELTDVTEDLWRETAGFLGIYARLVI